MGDRPGQQANELSKKSINNILAVLSKALRYADDVYVGLGTHGRAKHEENVVKKLSNRICRLAGLPESGWRRLRHTTGRTLQASA